MAAALRLSPAPPAATSTPMTFRSELESHA